MKEITLKDLDSRLQKQVENAKKAVDKNPAYAIDILSNIVQRNAGCLEARKILRQAQQRAKGGRRNIINDFLTQALSLPVKFTMDKKVEQDPEGAMALAEQMLTRDPANSVAHTLLGRAAEALELYDTAAFAYEELQKVDPSDVGNIKALMKIYIDSGHCEEAVRLGDSAYRSHPADDEIPALIRRASVEQSIEKGKWEEDESFRGKLKDEEEAQKLEQAGRAKTGESGLRSLIEESEKAIAEEPDNLNNYRDLAANYRRLGEYDNALEWVEKARQLESGRADVSLERLVGTLKREKMEKEISEKQEQLETDPENAELKQELERLEKEKHRFRVEQAEHLVHRYPNEFSYRHELGELYLEDGKIDDAIKELQLSQRSPKVRVASLILLGKAYKAKGFYDLATEQLTTAKNEIPGMTDQKKDVLYELGTCYELQEEMDKAMEQFKALYGADISYRDVADKIDAFYAKKQGN
ncbi:MAG: tetratricopeptide repeat protein [Opitutales bacterium]